MKRFVKNKKGQGTTEYIVILGIIVAIAVGILLPRLKPVLTGQVDSIVSQVQQTTH